MTRKEKQQQILNSITKNDKPTNVTEFRDYLVPRLLEFCIENDKPVSATSRSCGLYHGYFNEVTKVRDMTLDTAMTVLEHVGVFPKGLDVYGKIFDVYDSKVYGKQGFIDVPFCKKTFRDCAKDGTSMRISTVLTFVTWLGTDFETFVLWY